MRHSPTAAPVLLVEDDLDDSFILSQLLRRAGATNPLQIARDGDEAIHLLSKAGSSPDFPLPLAVFTDLDMPGCDGFELLFWMSQRRGFEQVFRAVVSISDGERDIRRCLALGAHVFVNKYPTADQFAALLSAGEAMRAGLPAIAALARLQQGPAWARNVYISPRFAPEDAAY